jgi:hydroxysqualene dehydroxylase
VTLLEAAPQCGGRSRTVQWHTLGLEIDNGQHILLGAYRQYLNLIKAIGINENDLFDRRPFEYHFIRKPNPLLAPQLSLIWNLFSAKGWTIAEKYRIARFVTRHITFGHKVPAQLSVLDWLKQGKQSEALIHHFWEPLLVAALSTPLHIASAQYAQNVLKDSLNGKPGSTDVLIPKVPLGKLFAEPMSAWLKSQGHTVLTHQCVSALLTTQEGNQCIGVQTKHQQFHGTVVLALPPRAVLPVIQPLYTLQPLANKLQNFTYESIITLYYAFPSLSISKTPSIPSMQAIVKDQSHYWLFCRQENQYTLFTAVFSGNGPHLNHNKDHLMDIVQADIQARHPSLNNLSARKYIQEKFAAFSATPDSLSLKPNPSPLPGLSLCGDYTNPLYPATLEGAVRSGLVCGENLE